MNENFTILIADRNRHVRSFLKREIMAEGYQIYLAKNAGEVLKWVYHREFVDLVIIDPDLPGANETTIMDGLDKRIPPLPVVVHAFPSEHGNYSNWLNTATFVEKQGDSIDLLKKIVFELLGNPDSKA